MKTNLYCLTALVSILCITSCTKVQLSEEQPENLNSKSVSPSKSSCNAISFNAQSLSDPDYHYSNFTKTVDPVTGRTTAIEVGIFSGGGFSEWIKFDVVYKNKSMALVLSGNKADTVMNIRLNNEGFADFTTNGNAPDVNFLPTKLKYKNGKLMRRSISFNGMELVANFSYDGNGNLTLMQDVSLFGEVPGRSEFSYDLNRSAANQRYFDEPRGFAENSYMVLQYLDLLPLAPKNLRTGSKVYWEDDYLVSDVSLTGHVVDGKGNLVSYKSVSPESGTEISQFTVNWSCPSNASEPGIQ
ncbi:MAG TPA: hypothetical protein VLC28_07915 [Flavitalea sp.]|nr:hypothetical protein [Flavitalea sp.]